MSSNTAAAQAIQSGAAGKGVVTGANASRCGMQRLRGEAGAREQHPFCSLCDSPASIDTPASMQCVRVPLRPGMRLFERGARIDCVYVVQDGIVKETMPSPDGSECPVRLIVRGGVAGLPAVVGATQPHSALVLQAGMACRVPLALIEALRTQDRAIVERLFHDWLRAVEDADCMMTVLGHGAARSRLARLLLMLGPARDTNAPLKLRQADMAELLAITPVSVARLLADFRREALLVERHRQIVSLDHDRLQRIARSPSGRVR